MLNRNPYMPLHFLILPYRHILQFNQLTPQEQQELLERGATWLKKLRGLGVAGAHFYFNLESKSAGASQEHLHGQFLPRWAGDRRALTYLLGKYLIQKEREQQGLLPKLYDLARGKHDENLVGAYRGFAQVLDDTALSDGDGENYLYEQSDCYVCNEVESQHDDEKHLVIKRFNHWTVLAHRFGYAGGHLRVVSREHNKRFDTITANERNELARVVDKTQFLLKQVVKPDGLNIAVNEGACAANPFEGHVLCDIVPRIVNDTSSTAVFDARPIVEKDADGVCARLKAAFEKDADGVQARLKAAFEENDAD